ncbi:ShlB/FhaC/HecB family hemolysin secretion/activation protein [Derxia gummosa]|uniref:ShlB/FhaC/HecB family hemolysin secretion/activation protein n=1 Tax=Derxia gummosa DSM 723 TaxID=1121388 RepID=A0A8B6X3C2_9BURK|nr:ShlB/FhaC/HecB family hemolysin secretion/activation protein [Derxia gummosa]
MQLPVPRSAGFVRRLLPACIALSACGAQAQTAPAAPPAGLPGIGDAIRESQPPAPRRAPERPPAATIDETGQTPLSLPSGATLTLREIRLEGADFLDAASLQKELEPYLGRPLTMADIDEAAARITARYRAAGYPVARAWVPRQDASGGVLRLQVIVGRFDKLRLRNDSPVRDSMIERVLAPLVAAPAITRPALERAMLQVSELSGATLPRFIVSPGQDAGTSDLDVEVGATPRLSGFILGDNHGSRFTGERRLSAGADIASPLGLGDRLGLTVMGTQDKGLRNGRLAYGLPLTGDGLRADVALTKITYELGRDYADLDAAGRSQGVDLQFGYPLLRGRDRSLWLSVAGSARQMRDEVGLADTINPRQAKAVTLGLRYEAWGSLAGRQTYTALNAGFTDGHLAFKDAAQAAANRVGADTGGHYGRLNLGGSGNLDLGAGFTLGLNASGQKALRDKNLDSSEQFAVSGPNAVKAYREWVSADNGWLLGGELVSALPAVGPVAQTVSLFADMGRVWRQRGDWSAAPNGTRLADVGIGWAARVQALAVRFQFARAVGAEVETGNDQARTRLLLAVGATF